MRDIENRSGELCTFVGMIFSRVVQSVATADAAVGQYEGK